MKVSLLRCGVMTLGTVVLEKIVFEALMELLTQRKVTNNRQGTIVLGQMGYWGFQQIHFNSWVFILICELTQYTAWKSKWFITKFNQPPCGAWEGL